MNPVRFRRHRDCEPHAIELNIDREVAKATARIIGLHLANRRPFVGVTDETICGGTVLIHLDYHYTQAKLDNTELVALVRRSLRSARRLLNPARTPIRRATIGRAA